MTAAAWMAGASVGTWLAAAAVLDWDGARAALFGMLGPLGGACVSWVLAERTYRRDPARLTGLMVVAFGANMVFFGVYVTAVVVLLAVRPIPFVVSFTGYFIALHLGEALLLRRLFAGDAGGSR